MTLFFFLSSLRLSVLGTRPDTPPPKAKGPGTVRGAAKRKKKTESQRGEGNKCWGEGGTRCVAALANRQ